jgi:hypothetical protein
MANNTLLASDNFASGSLAAGWSAQFGLSVCKVVSGTPNVTEPNATSTQAGQIWTGQTWPADHSSEITIHALTAEANTLALLQVRWQTGAASGYQANIGNSTAALYVLTAGSSTQLGSTVSGLTIAAGDVWCLQAAGACISLYQNWIRVAYWYDATYTSGNPGFGQTTGTNITHTQVASWRGYSAVQQDGIWQKQGIVIAANATDLVPSGSTVFGAFQNTAILYESNAQILSGTVYKTWFSSGTGSTANIYYAESPDGVNWTRSASAVLAAYTNPAIIKHGSTYYMYCQLGTATTGSVYLYTSTDGISWAQQSSSILVSGGGAAWDDDIFLLAPIGIISGTWYGLYTGSASGATLYKMGLATSTDGAGLTWTKYAGNPVLNDAIASQAVVQVNGVWYAWVLSNQAGQGTNQDPFDVVRYQSSDLINWTLSSHSLHHTQQFESLNFNTGGVSPTAIIDIGGKAHFYTLSSPSDAIQPSIYQTALAIGPAPIASIIQFSEDGSQQVSIDPFTSGTGNLSPNWTTPIGLTKLQIVAGDLVEASVLSTVCAQYNSGSVFSSDQYSEITIGALSSTFQNGFIQPIVRSQSSGGNWYQANIASPAGTKSTTNAIYKNVAGSLTQIGPASVGVTPQVGDVFRLSVVGSNPPVLTLYQNGYVILQVQDYSNEFLTGAPGIYIYEETNLSHSQVSLWTGGNANVIPNYISGGAGSGLLRLLGVN